MKGHATQARTGPTDSRISAASVDPRAIRQDHPSPASVTLIVLTLNEQLNLPHCLTSVEGLVDKIVVVDSGSGDGTQEVAARFGASVIEHPFENQASQFNWALEHLRIDTEWVLRLDADEYLMPELRDEIRATLPRLPRVVTGLFMKRRMVFQGRWVRHGGLYPKWLLRLFRTGMACSEFREMDEHLVVTEGETRRLRHDFVDHNRKDLSFWVRKHESYAAREAKMLRSRERGDLEPSGHPGKLLGDPRERTRWRKSQLYDRIPLFVRAFGYFIYRYVVRLGFLDGRPGLVYHVLQGFWYRFYVDAKLWEMRRGATES